MPNLDTKLHIAMLRESETNGQIARDGVYGMQWGDPQKVQFLRAIRDRFIYPYLNPDHRAVEIGPGGGRWTRYLLSFGELIAVDYYQPLLDELARNYRIPHLVPLKNNGTDFPGVADHSVDYLFSFGTFVHIEMPLIKAYLSEIRRILRGRAVIQYSDKTKQMAIENKGFSENNPTLMLAAVIGAGFRVIEQDTESLPHSSVIVFE